MRSTFGSQSGSRDSTPLLGHKHGIFKSGPYKRPPWYRDPMFYMNVFRRALAEFLATGLLVFVTISAMGTYAYTSSATLPALAAGFAFAALMAATIHVSGGHMNPAITLGVFVAGGINVVAAVVYFVAQLAGSLTGAACVLAYDTDSNDSFVDYGLTYLHGSTKPWQGLLVELLLTLMLVMVFVHSTMEQQRPTPVASVNNSPTPNIPAPIVSGFAYAAGIMASFSITGGSMNPTRSLAAAVVSSAPHRWNDHYVYWIGPLLGALIAGLFYRIILSSRPLIPITDPAKER